MQWMLSMRIYLGVWLGLVFSVAGLLLASHTLAMVVLVLTALLLTGLRPTQAGKAGPALPSTENPLNAADTHLQDLVQLMAPNWSDSLGRSRELLQSNIGEPFQRFHNIAARLEGSLKNSEGLMGSSGVGESLRDASQRLREVSETYQTSSSAVERLLG